MDVERYLIVGLGNPGPKYAANRHNVGFQCLDHLAAAHGLSFDKRQKRARVALGAVCGRRVVLAQPQTFMNDSGCSVAPLVQFYRIPPERLLIVYDDLDLPLETLRMRSEGGSGGHNGLRSIIEQLGDQGFARLRIGIGRPPGQMDPAAYVLQDFVADEGPVVEETLGRAVAAIETWLTEGIEMAMSRHNSGPSCL
ncbi:MAG: aminoacyl-tRNA hydrolase [Anaerolineae bacterium]|nr:aminoacyl-tRNA hydrolase [Anaerolineae bacterium]